jgi:hypothetical protein
MPKPSMYSNMFYTYQHFALQLYDFFIYRFALDWFFTFGGILIHNVYLCRNPSLGSQPRQGGCKVAGL